MIQIKFYTFFYIYSCIIVLNYQTNNFEKAKIVILDMIIFLEEEYWLIIMFPL